MLRHFLIVFTLNLNVLCELLNKNEGSRCSWKEASGMCVSIYKCESAKIFLKTREYPPCVDGKNNSKIQTCSTQNSATRTPFSDAATFFPICTFKGKEPVICCTDCTVVDDIRKIVFNPHTELLSLTGQKANDKCVNFVDKLSYDCKINARTNYTRHLDPVSNCYTIGVSTEAIPGELPPHRESYLALLGYGDDIKTAQWSCAGAIISKKYILTAAHCLSKEKLGPVKYIALGIHKRTDPPEMWQKYNVKRVIPHPEYQPPSKYHDIGLLETEEKITFSREVLPACLHSDPNMTASQANILVWDSDSKDQGALKQIPLLLLDEMQCSIFYPPHHRLADGFNDTSQTCYAEFKRPTDSCQSDSGSLLVAIPRAFGCAPTVLGVTSFDRTCGSAGSAGLFTKVFHYIPWIESIVWP